MLTPAEERRNHKRRELLLLLPVYEAQGNQVVGALGDISMTGIMLFSSLPIMIHEEHHLVLQGADLQQIMRYKNAPETIQLCAQSRWRTMIKPELYKIGFKFTEISEPTLNIIRDLVRQLWSQRSIGNSFVEMTLMIEEIFELDRLYDISDHVRELPGVIAVSFRAENNRMMNIQYHPEQTSCNQLLDTLRQQQIQARLVRI
jgi:hypothetical protein